MHVNLRRVFSHATETLIPISSLIFSLLVRTTGSLEAPRITAVGPVSSDGRPGLNRILSTGLNRLPRLLLVWILPVDDHTILIGSPTAAEAAARRVVTDSEARLAVRNRSTVSLSSGSTGSAAAGASTTASTAAATTRLSAGSTGSAPAAASTTATAAAATSATAEAAKSAETTKSAESSQSAKAAAAETTEASAAAAPAATTATTAAAA